MKLEGVFHPAWKDSQGNVHPDSWRGHIANEDRFTLWSCGHEHGSAKEALKCAEKIGKPLVEAG